MSHPILEATASVGVALKSVADVNPTFMSTDQKAAALRELVRLEARVTELRLRIMVDADDVADQTASRDAADWLAAATRVRHEDARADLALAVALDRRWGVLASALRDGEVTIAQAQVIARALGELPHDVPSDAVQQAESVLVAHAASFGPRQLARLGHRILDVVAPEIAEAAEARRLADLESHARRRTRLTLRRLGDGTTRFGGILPDPVADRLATSLEAVDPRRLPLHGGDATTVIVTISLDALRADLGTAELLGAGHVPGQDGPSYLTASETRRLACTSQLLPAVLGGTSEVLDLGRSRRLFSAAQRKGLLLRDRHCRAEGCDIPGTWAEAHHWDPWHHGGRTDLADGVLLCHHHHQRVHDPHYSAERLPSGDVRFHRRT